MLASDPNIFRAILDSLQIGVYLLDRNRRIVFWNRGAERITGYQRHEVVGHLCQENILPDCGDQGCGLCGATCPLALTIHEGKAKEANVYFRHHDGHKAAMQVWAVPVRDENETVIGVAESFYESRTTSSRNRRGILAIHGCLDSTTGVGNSDFTFFHLREYLASFHEYGLPFGVVSLRVNNLEYFKSAYGRLAQDEVMNLIVENARNGIRPTDFIGRISEDQFLVIALNCARTGLEKVLHRIQKVTNHMELKWWGDKLEISLSIGAACVQHDDTPESLLLRAGVVLKESTKAAAPGAEF